jgi:hypothetical protein
MDMLKRKKEKGKRKKEKGKRKKEKESICHDNVS